MNYYAALQFLRYAWQAQTSIRLHSPTAFKLQQELSHFNISIEDLKTIHSFKQDWLISQGNLDFINEISQDKTVKYRANKISNQYLLSSLSDTYIHLLITISKYFNCTRHLELGTGFGSSALCFLMAKPAKNQLISLDANAALQQLVNQNLRKYTSGNYQLIPGLFEDTLKDVLKNNEAFDLYFIDGHHQYAPTLSYFNSCLESAHEQSVFVLDDINWSSEMRQAWLQIIDHPRVRMSIDFYRMGIVLIDPAIRGKQELVLWK